VRDDFSWFPPRQVPSVGHSFPHCVAGTAGNHQRQRRYTPVAPPPRPPIVGFVDTHLHQFANLGFGGLDVWGSPMDPLRDPAAPLAAARARALPNSDCVSVSEADAANYLSPGGVPATTTSRAETCDDGSCWPQCPAGTGVAGNACVKITIHGADGTGDLLNQLVPHGSDSHGVFGYPDMNGWPAFDGLTTQQAYWEWLSRSHDHGLKLIVMLAVNNSVLCQLAMRLGAFGCSDDGAVARQIQGAKDLQTYIDGRAGGPGLGFYRIVYSSEEARAAIQAGKLAVVLGTEVDTSWGCTTGAAFCNDGYIRDRVAEYHAQGIRVVYCTTTIRSAGACCLNWECYQEFSHQKRSAPPDQWDRFRTEPRRSRAGSRTRVGAPRVVASL